MLRRLELRGFKSFAMATSLELGPGVNVIVGPNGSGKSNLAEALVWAMGEQRASRLRAGGMGEVVFSGGQGRPPAGLAEVSMTLSRDGDTHPEAAAETAVTRRVTRTGDAHYRLNGVSCRLLDIQEELAARGLGPDALAVIRQGQVDTVCAARPADLRAVIEEAAGVALQKRRRKRAEHKLARVADRLDRARDLATELTSRAASLERQARQAELAADLERRIEEGRSRLSAASAVHAAQALTEARRRSGEASQADAEAVRLLQEARQGLAAADGRVAPAQAARERQADLARTLRTAADRLTGRAELSGERVDQARRAMDKARQERDAAMAARGEAEAAAQRAAHRVGRCEVTLAEAEAALAAARGAHDTHQTQHRDAAAAAADARHARDEARRAHQAAQGAVQRAETALQQAVQRLEALERDGRIPDLARHERRAEVSAQRVVRWRQRVEAAGRVADDAAAARAAGEAERREAAAEVARHASAAAPQRGTLGFELTVSAGAERAVGAALEALAEAVMAPDLATGRRAVSDGAHHALVPTTAAPPDVAPVPGRGPCGSASPPLATPRRPTCGGCWPTRGWWTTWRPPRRPPGRVRHPRG
ncbi:MAG: AAA family ATPase [Thermoleophilia bacterium]